jgi:hypothetical protein
MTTLPNSMLVGISSPYRKAGLLHAKFKRHFGCADDDVLVIRAPTAALNPTIDAAVIAAAIEDDPAAAKASAPFRSAASRASASNAQRSSVRGAL